MNLFRKFSVTKATIRKFSKETLDAENLFLNPKIFNLLQNIIDHNPSNVHKLSIRKRGNPVIKLLSNEQHKELEKSTQTLTKQKLQMPPIMNPRQDNVEIIEKNDKLSRFLPSGNKIVYVDIGMNDKNRDRLMVIRESDGVLRTPSFTERDRYNLVYFPLPGREFIPPPMFNDDNLLKMMNEGKYVYILDRNCIQFEPDDPCYITICHKVYEHVNDNFDKLHGFRSLGSTRHFGGLILYFVMRDNIGNVMLDLLSLERLDAVNDLLTLYTVIHPESRFAICDKSDEGEGDVLARVERFLDTVSATDKQKKKIKFVLDCNREMKMMNKQTI